MPTDNNFIRLKGDAIKNNIVYGFLDDRKIALSYYIFEHGQYPYIWEIDDNKSVLIDNTLKTLQEKYPEYIVLFEHAMNYDSYNQIIVKITDLILVEFTYIGPVDYSEYLGLEDLLRKKMTVCTNVKIYYHPLYKDEIEKIKEIVKENTIDLSEIGMANVGVVSKNIFDDSFEVSTFDLSINLSDSFYDEMDLHYGKGFEEYFNNLIKLIENNKKGIILFHGDAGTGKSFCIRHLIKFLNKKGKTFIYLPSELLMSVTEPGFLSFLISQVSSNREYNKNIILIIEDAESLLMNREESGGMNGISNLLNLTDGILNDILHFQIIATFNTELKNLDDALLRSGRLLSRKYFSKLTLEQATLLIEKLKLDLTPKAYMTLSDIYSYKNEISILYHNIDEPKPKQKLGFIIE